MNSTVLQINSNHSTGDRGGKSSKTLLLILAVAFGLRLLLVPSPEVIRNDGTEYIRSARQILSGDWSGGKAPPLYPLLIAFFHFVTPNDEMAGIWVSVIFGTLIVLPIFFLGKDIFNEKVGIVGALMGAVHPFLYAFSGSVMTETTYCFFLASATLFGWKTFSDARFLSIILFSLFTTLAYLTRPEAVGFLFIFCNWILWINPPGGRRPWMKRLGISFLALFCFIVFASPYLIQIKRESGKWGISQKVSISPGSLSGDQEIPTIEKMRKTREFPLTTIIKNPLSAIKKIGTGMFISLYKFQQGFHPFLLLLAIGGVIHILKEKTPCSLKGNFYLMSYLIFFFGFVFPFFLILRRYASQMIPIALPWASVGFWAVIDWIYKRQSWKVSKRLFMTVSLLIILMGLFIQGSLAHNRDFRFIQRDAGLWMKEYLPEKGKIMSSMPQEAFYAEFPWTHMPPKSYEVILREARSQRVRYLVIDEKIEKDSPGFLGKITKDDLTLIRDFKRKERTMVVFEVVYPKGQ